MSNIFLSETIQSYAKSPNARGHGEYVFHNGYWAMDIEPATFYKGSDEVKDAHVLSEEFIPNTRYVFDIWVDVDAIIYNDINRPAGLRIFYTDGSSDSSSLITTGSHDPATGYQHLFYVSPSNKSVDYLTVYYWSSSYVYYRADSYICPLDEIQLYQTGVLNIQNTTESLSGIKDFEILHGNISSTKIIEI